MPPCSPGLSSIHGDLDGAAYTNLLGSPPFHTPAKQSSHYLSALKPSSESRSRRATMVREVVVSNMVHQSDATLSVRALVDDDRRLPSLQKSSDSGHNHNHHQLQQRQKQQQQQHQQQPHHMRQKSMPASSMLTVPGQPASEGVRRGKHSSSGSNIATKKKQQEEGRLAPTQQHRATMLEVAENQVPRSASWAWASRN